MNWNTTDRDDARDDIRDVQDTQPITKQTPATSLLSEVRNATASLTELHLSGYDMFVRLIRR